MVRPAVSRLASSSYITELLYFPIASPPGLYRCEK
nr:MAG TPA: hypothetical protein [Bacteriophage sp.]